MAAHVEEDRFRPLAQCHHIDAQRNREQDVPHAHALSRAVSTFVRGVMATARFFRGFGHVRVLLQQRVNGVGCRFADYAVGGGYVVRIQQAGGLRGLAQQLGAGRHGLRAAAAWIRIPTPPQVIGQFAAREVETGLVMGLRPSIIAGPRSRESPCTCSNRYKEVARPQSNNCT
jgi:hypothetical protein